MGLLEYKNQDGFDEYIPCKIRFVEYVVVLSPTVCVPFIYLLHVGMPENRLILPTVCAIQCPDSRTIKSFISLFYLTKLSYNTLFTFPMYFHSRQIVH